MSNKDNFIALLSGARMNYHNPEESDVTIDDIATALSNNCRFSGHLPRFYSIAQHLVNTSRIVPVEQAFTGLMHDTAEAFTNDLPTPLKWEFPVFKELEQRIESAMSKRFGFEYPYPPEVKLADTQMLILEKFHVKVDETIWPNYEDWTRERVEHLLPLVDLESWQPRRAKREFLERYYELQSEDNETKQQAEARRAAQEFFRQNTARTSFRTPSSTGKEAAHARRVGRARSRGRLGRVLGPVGEGP